MANLKALRQKIKNITDYSPELAQFNDQLDELINDAYYSLWCMKRWNFTTKITTMRLHTDITPTSDTENNFGNPVAIQVFAGSREVRGLNADRLRNVDIWEGQPFEINSMEYTISTLSSLGWLLDRPYDGPSETTLNWKIKKRWYDLPEDCLELLYIGHRDYPYVSVSGSQNPYGKSTAIMPRREEDLDLRVDYTQDYAEAYIQAPVQNILSAERTNVRIAVYGTANFLAGEFYEFTWAFVKNGKVSALAEPFVYQVEENNQAMWIDFLSWDDNLIYADAFHSKDQVPVQWEGYRKVILWNKNFDRVSGERKGLPCWIYVTNGSKVGGRNNLGYLDKVIVPAEDNKVLIAYKDQLDNGSERYIEIDGNHQQIRPYPRPIGWDYEVMQTYDSDIDVQVYHDYIREVVIRYMVKPQDLLLASDVPQMPYEFHQLIVYKALEDIYLKLGQQGLAATYEKKYMKEINGLAKRYVDKIDSEVVRGRFHMSMGRPTYDGSSLRRLP
jgi:hypothetical protein